MEGKKFSIYMKKEQLEYVDKEAEKLDVSRSKYIEIMVLPEELQTLGKRKGAKKGSKK